MVYTTGQQAEVGDVCELLIPNTGSWCGPRGPFANGKAHIVTVADLHSDGSVCVTEPVERIVLVPADDKHPARRERVELQHTTEGIQASMVRFVRRGAR